MRHRSKKIVLNTTRRNHTTAIVRNLVTALLEHGRVTTTAKKAKILVSEAEKLISGSKKRDNVHAIREAGKMIYKDEVAKSFFQTYLPTVEHVTSGFVRTFRMGFRSGDNAPKVMVELIKHGNHEKKGANKTTEVEATKEAKKTTKAPVKKTEAAKTTKVKTTTSKKAKSTK